MVAGLIAAGGIFLGIEYGGGGTPPTHPRTGTPTSGAAERRQISRVAARDIIVATGLGARSVVWAMNGLALYLSRDGGAHWFAATPPGVYDVVARIGDIVFVDREHAWAAASDLTGARPPRHMAIYRTTDGGRTWRPAAPPGCYYRCGGGFLSFLDRRKGFSLASVWPRGRLFETRDGGAAWTLVAPAPFIGPIRFVSLRDGWGVRSDGGALFRTTDGGRIWRRVRLARPATATIGVPTFFGPRDGVVPVWLRDPRTHAERVVAYVTRNGGRSWSARPVPAAADLRGESWGFAASIPFSAPTVRDWVLFPGPSLYATHDGGRTWTIVHPRFAPTAPHVSDPSFSSPSSGWAIFTVGAGSALVRTTDGGRDWKAVAPR